MKAKYSFLIASIISSNMILAQTKVCYNYDKAGNRTDRTLCLKSMPTEADSLVIAQPITETLGEMQITLYPKILNDECIDFSSNYSFELNIENELYSIYRIDDIAEDFSFVAEISSGKFKLRRGKYYLTDSIGKVQLVYKLQDNKLYPLKTYCDLSKIIWIHFYSDLLYPMCKDTAYEDHILSRKEQINELSLKKYDLYSSGSIHILFFHDKISSYEIYADGDLISSGTWVKRFSKIVIRDECLNNKFYFRFKNGILIKNNFPRISSVQDFEKFIK